MSNNPSRKIKRKLVKIMARDQIILYEKASQFPQQHIKVFNVGDRVRIVNVNPEALYWPNGTRTMRNNNGCIGTVIEDCHVKNNGEGVYGVRLDNEKNPSLSGYYQHELEPA